MAQSALRVGGGISVAAIASADFRTPRLEGAAQSGYRCGAHGYGMLPERRYLPSASKRSPHRPALLVEHIDAMVPVRHVLMARIGFRGRFDRAVKRTQDGGGDVSPVQAALAFGDALALNVAPAKISQRMVDQVDDGRRMRRTDGMFLFGGDWSPLLFPLDNARVHVEILQVCRAREAFRDTSRYRALARQIGSGERIRRGASVLRSLADLDAYYGYCLDLVESIDRNGLQPRGALGEGALKAHHGVRTWWQDRVERDVGVAVAEDGALVHHGSGRHRLAVAIGLGLERIPVEVRLVHSGWLTAQAARLGLPPHVALGPALAGLGV